MSMRTEATKYHDAYEDGPDRFRIAVDAAYDAARAAIEARGYECGNSDDAEKCVAMIARYIIESNPLEFRA